jgi:hypothetical protein
MRSRQRSARPRRRGGARGNLLEILTAGDDAEACDDCEPETVPADGRRRDHSSKVLIQPEGKILL